MEKALEVPVPTTTEDLWKEAWEGIDGLLFLCRCRLVSIKEI